MARVPLNVTLIAIPGHHRSRIVCAAMREGIERMGDRVSVQSSLAYMHPQGDVAVFYGFAGRLANALRDYPASGKPAVYVDLGFWGRKEGGRFAGYHKLSVNARHPTAYFQARPHDPSRAKRFGLEPAPWRISGEHILVAGMGPKGARAEGYPPLGWEQNAVDILRRHTQRPIVYRPKPNWLNPPPLQGATMAPMGQSLDDALANCHAVVTHHSNAAVEAITAGVPAFVVEGCALPMASSDLAKIETPVMPEGRAQWLADVSWVQWSVSEMSSGAAWAYLKNEGLVGQ